MRAEEALGLKNTAIAAVAQAMASPVRLQILGILGQAEHSVDALAEKIGESRANTSAQLKVLTSAGLLKSRKDGRRVYYQPTSERVNQLLGALASASAELHSEMRELVHTFFHLPERFDRKSVRDLKRRMNAGDVIVIDLRPPDEHAAGHPRGVINIPSTELEAHLAEFDGQEILAFCRGRYCVVAEESTQRLKEMGQSASNLGASSEELVRLGLGT